MKIKVEVPIKATAIYYLNIDVKDPNEFEDAIDDELEVQEPSEINDIEVQFDDVEWEEVNG